MWVPPGVATFACWVVGPRNRAGKAPGHDSWCATPCAGEGDHKGRPYDVVVAGDAVGAGRRSPSPIPQEIRPEVIVGGGPGNVHRSGTVGAPLVGAPRGRNVRLLGGRAAQPGRQGTRPRLVVCDAVCRRGRPQGSPLRCGGRGRRGWRRSSIIFPDSPGNHAGRHRWGRTWKHPPTGDRRGTPCGCPPGSQRSPAGWSNRATGPARGPVTTCGGRRRVQGEGDHKGRPYDAVAAGDAFGAGCRSPSPIPQEIMPEGTGGGGPGNVRRPGTVGASLVGALRRRIVRLLGGGAAQPGRQGVRSRPAVGAVRKGGGPQGRPLRSKSGPERHVWGDANVGLIGRCRTAGTIRRSTIAAQSG